MQKGRCGQYLYFPWLIKLCFFYFVVLLFGGYHGVICALTNKKQVDMLDNDLTKMLATTEKSYEIATK